MKYSQNNEQEFIENYFLNYGNGNGGKFLDIGAYDPFKFSNTRCLYEKGWRGIYVEPSPICFERFKETYGKDPRIQLLNYAISTNDGSIIFYESNGDAISTTSIQHKDKWERGAGVKYQEIIVPTMSMAKLLSQFGADIDFLSLDTESTNIELFELLPNDFLHRLKMICIEHDNHYVQIENKLQSFGFRKIHINGENLIMAK